MDVYDTPTPELQTILANAEDIVTDASLIVALKATFLPEAARDVRATLGLVEQARVEQRRHRVEVEAVGIALEHLPANLLHGR